ncbi:MAG: PIN domain-containing protein [Chloroflexi bacterium]|nr:PIN domain-containing protein [Chloroflexota bacterium]
MAYVKDVNHASTGKLLSVLAKTRAVIPAPVLQELFFMITVRIRYERAVNFFEQLQLSDFVIQPLLPEDMTRMTEIMRQYADTELDYTDTAIMALAERLNIRQVHTFDHRDFRIFRPKHCDYLELLPELR